MRYVIMANGQGLRWGGHRGVPKHLVEVGSGESLIARTVRMVQEADAGAEVVVSAHDERYAVAGARLYTPEHGELEIDRFVPELLDQPCCYLYGDTYYTVGALARVCAAPRTAACDGAQAPRLLFFGNERRIFAVQMADYAYARGLILELRAQIEAGRIADCKGWQLYHRHLGLPLAGHAIAGDYVLIEDGTTDFNTPEEYEAFRRG